MAKLENGRLRLSLDYAEEIADVLGVSIFEVLGFDDVGVRPIPVIGVVHAGNWGEAVEMSEERQAIPGDVRGVNLFALRPTGDSMDLIVQEGGFIVVDPDDRDLKDGKLYTLMNMHGETTFKRFCASPLQFEPVSTNPNHQPIPIGSEPFQVIGRVVYTGQPL